MTELIILLRNCFVNPHAVHHHSNARRVRERRASAGVSGWTEVIALNEAHLSFGRCSLEWAACAHAHFTRVRRGQVKVTWFATAAASSVLIYSLLKSWVIYCNAGCFLTRDDVGKQQPPVVISFKSFDDCLVKTNKHSPLHECINLVNTNAGFFLQGTRRDELIADD